MIVLGHNFFNRSTLDVARDLLGKRLICEVEGLRREVVISETEAYDGFEDRASHAHRGKTPRNEIMFGPAGFWYVYFVYGMHEMLNVTTGPEGYPAAVLIRGGFISEGKRIVGPARLTKYLGVTRMYNKKRAVQDSGLWIEDTNFNFPGGSIVATPRIGVDYAGSEWSSKLYRFVVADDYRGEVY